MRKILLHTIISFLLISCSKSGGSGGGSQPEAAIAFSMNASNNSITPSNSLAVIVTLTSAMPSSQGIKIETTVIDQTTNSSINQNPYLTSLNAKNTINLISLPQQHWCMATIKVSSIATPSNNAVQSFTVVYK